MSLGVAKYALSLEREGALGGWTIELRAKSLKYPGEQSSQQMGESEILQREHPVGLSGRQSKCCMSGDLSVTIYIV